MTNHDINAERLGPSDTLGVAFTVNEIVLLLSRFSPDLLNRNLPIFSSRNDTQGIAFHHHAFVDSTKDYISFTHVEHQ
jgi:hypothetical protein